MIASRSPVPVAVLGASRLFGESLAARLRGDPRIATARALDVAEEWPLGATGDPPVVLVEAHDDAGRTEALCEAVALTGARVVVVGLGDDDPSAVGLVEAGAVGFVPREAAFEQLVETLVDAWHGRVSGSPGLVARLLARLREQDRVAGDAEATPPEPLTSRQNEIAGLVAAGLANKQIARRLGIRPATVRNHVHEILRRRHLKRRGELAPRTRESGTAREDGTLNEGVWGRC